MHPKKTFQISLLLCCVFLSLGLSYSSADQALHLSPEWKSFSSCLDLKEKVKSVLEKNEAWSNSPDQQTLSFPSPRFFSPAQQEEEIFFLAHYNAETHAIFVTRGPKKQETKILDISSPKLLGKIPLPKDAGKPEIKVVKNKILVQLNQQTAEKELTHLLIYQLKNNKLQLITHQIIPGSVQVQDLKNNQWSVLIEDRAAFATDMASFLKKPVQELLPSREVKSYWGESTSHTTACQGLAYHLPLHQKLLSFYTFIRFNIEQPETVPIVNSFIGAFDGVFLLPDALYSKTYLPMVEESCANCVFSETRLVPKTLIQQIGREPRPHYKEAFLIAGELIDWGIVEKGKTISFFSQLNSGKLYSVLVTVFNKETKQTTTKSLLSAEGAFSHLEQHGDALYLVPKSLEEGTAVFAITDLFPYFWGKIPLTPDRLPFFYDSNADLKKGLILINAQKSGISLRFWEIELPWIAAQGTENKAIWGILPFSSKHNTLKLEGFELAGNANWDAASKTLLLPLKKSDSSFLGVKGFKINEQGIQERFSRNYVKSSSWIRWLWISDLFAYTISDRLVDFYLLTNPKSMKALPFRR